MQSYPNQEKEPKHHLHNPDYLTIQHLFYGTILQYRTPTTHQTPKTQPITQPQEKDLKTTNTTKKYAKTPKIHVARKSVVEKLTDEETPGGWPFSNPLYRPVERA